MTEAAVCQTLAPGRLQLVGYPCRKSRSPHHLWTCQVSPSSHPGDARLGRAAENFADAPLGLLDAVFTIPSVVHPVFCGAPRADRPHNTRIAVENFARLVVATPGKAQW